MQELFLNFSVFFKVYNDVCLPFEGLYDITKKANKKPKFKMTIF